MLNDIMIGRYVPTNSIIHRLDSRLKIIAVTILIITIFIPKTIVMYVVLSGLLLVLIKLTKLPIKIFLKGLKPLRFLIIFMLIFNIFLMQEGKIIFTIYTIDIYSGSINNSVIIIMRLLVLISVTSVLTLTTTPMELTDGLESVMKPLEYIKVPTHEIAMMVSIALRFIPTLLDETEKIMKAQTSRGVDFVDSKLQEKVVAIISLLVPLFISAFQRAEELANAMEARGYTGGEGRTKFRKLVWSAKDTIALMIVILVLVLTIIFTIMGI